ncbi:MAG: hypothetical protein NW207_04810 [Cytophagales bacterium]|nr:hypothetical protein [Cytophagales bacterium]
MLQNVAIKYQRKKRRLKNAEQHDMGLFWTVSPTISDADIVAGFEKDIDNWLCSQWRTYYERIKIKYGQAKALDVIRIDSERIGWFAKLHNCKYDCNFIDYFKKEGLEGGNLISKVYCAGTDVAGAIGDTASAVGNVGDVLSALTDKKILLSGVLIAGITFIYINYGKQKR